MKLKNGGSFLISHLECLLQKEHVPALVIPQMQLTEAQIDRQIELRVALFHVKT